MTVSYLVRYQGAAEHPEAFLGYYRTRHAPILREFPRIRRLVLHRPVDWHDPFPGTRENNFLIAEMVFASGEDLNAALASEARARARADFANFPKFTGRVTRAAMAAEDIAL